MTEVIVSSAEPIGLAGGAPQAVHQLRQAAPHVAGWVAADGGADLLLSEEIAPRAVIGDMDSLSDRAKHAFAPVLHHISEQETTDFDKALRSVAAPLLICVGFTGGRFDHELAAMNTLVRHADRALIVLGAETLAFHCPPDVTVDLAPGTLVSLFPLCAMRLRSDGLVWPTDAVPFAPNGRIGTSNAAQGGPVRLHPSGPGMLVILPAQALRPAIAALSAA